MIWGNRFAGVHLHVLEDGKHLVNAVVLERNGDDLKMIDSIELSSSKKELKNIGVSGVPTSLVLTGKGVFQKRLTRNLGGELEQVRGVLDEYAGSDVVNTNTYNENWLYVDLMRSESVDRFMKELRRCDIDPIWVDVGTSCAWNLLQHMDGQSPVLTGIHEFSFDHAGLTNVRVSEESYGNYRLDEDTISGSSILPYASIISLLNGPVSGDREGNHLTASVDEVYYGNSLKKTGMLAILTVFVILLVNAGLFMHYHEKKGELEVQLSEHRGKLTELNTLEENLNQKKHIASVSGSSTHGDFAYFTDQVVAELEPDIRLTGLAINPIQPKDPLSDRIKVRSNVMEVEGSCDKGNALNIWVGKLEQLTDVMSVTIVDFGKTRSGSENTFLLEITFNG